MSAANTISELVRQQYDHYPFPDYPFFAKPKWWEGYSANPNFSRVLTRARGRAQGSILIAGCGSIQPYVIAKWAPREAVSCVDFSSASSRRARLRTLLCPNVTVDTAEITDWLFRSNQQFGHVDIFGVLHHLPNPSTTLKILVSRMTPGATLRMMVYNSYARQWIHDIRKGLLGWLGNNIDKNSIAKAMQLLSDIRSNNSDLAFFLRMLNQHSFTSRPQFIDTFLNRREAILPATWWLKQLEANGLTLLSLFDRYGELDHLSNPLISPIQAASSIDKLTKTLTLSGNLELIYQKPAAAYTTLISREKHTNAGLRPPPRFWTSFEETKTLPKRVLRQLWMRHLEHLATSRPNIEPKQLSLSTRQLQRLSRIGAIFPSQIEDLNYRKTMIEPMEAEATHAAVQPLPKLLDLAEDWKRQLPQTTILRLERANDWCSRNRHTFQLAENDK